MRSRLCLLVFTICAFSLYAADLAQWKFKDKDSINNAKLWVDVKSGARASKSFVTGENEGALKVTIHNGNLHPAKVQLFFASKVNIRAGEKYSVKFKIKTENPERIIVQCALGVPPWTRLGKKSSLVINTKGKQWETRSLEFTADKDLRSLCRVPAFLLGGIKTGSSIELSEIKFIGPDSAQANIQTSGSKTDLKKK